MDIIAFILVFIGIVFISNCIHECGHGMGAKWCKYKNIVISIGTGKKLVSFRLLNIEWNIYTVFFSGGHTSYEPPHSYQPLDIMLISMMGPLVNGIIVFILLLATNVYEHIVVYIFFLFNAWLILGNSVPIKWKDKASDGYIALKMIYEQLKIQSKG